MGKYIFLLCVAFFLLHQIAQKTLGIGISWADSYLDPLLLMPILLQGITWERSWLLGKRIQLQIPEIIFWTIAASILFEYFFPKWNTKFTADIWDVACYFAGSILFYFTKKNA